MDLTYVSDGERVCFLWDQCPKPQGGIGGRVWKHPLCGLSWVAAAKRCRQPSVPSLGFFSLVYVCVLGGKVQMSVRRKSHVGVCSLRLVSVRTHMAQCPAGLEVLA